MSLIVGYADGLLEIWELKTLTMELVPLVQLPEFPQTLFYFLTIGMIIMLNVAIACCSCRVKVGESPLSHLVVQYPEDDPRNVCYVWALDSKERPGLSVAHLYAVTYENKDNTECHGIIYQVIQLARAEDLNKVLTCWCDHIIGPDPYSGDLRV